MEARFSFTTDEKKGLLFALPNVHVLPDTLGSPGIESNYKINISAYHTEPAAPVYYKAAQQYAPAVLGWVASAVPCVRLRWVRLGWVGFGLIRHTT